MPRGIRNVRPEDLPRDLVDRFAQSGLEITAVSMNILSQYNNGVRHRQPMNFADFAHTAPASFVLWYEISHRVDGRDMTTWRRWEYTVSNENMRWMGCGIGDGDGPSPDLVDSEEELALELLGVLI